MPHESRWADGAQPHRTTSAMLLSNCSLPTVSPADADDIARAAGIARNRTLFHYYASKNAIPWGDSLHPPLHSYKVH